MGLRSRVAVSCCAASAGAFAIGLALGGKRARGGKKGHVGESPTFGGGGSGRASRVGGTMQGGETLGGGVTQFFDCPVCLTEMVLPRLVPCGHTLCSRCLVSLLNHERRPACPVCRKRIRVGVEKLPVNFTLKSCVEARVQERGEEAWEEYVVAEQRVRELIEPCGAGEEGATRTSIVAQLQPAWNWFKWTIIIMTELGAFMASLKEILEAAPNRTRLFQRVV